MLKVKFAALRSGFSLLILAVLLSACDSNKREVESPSPQAQAPITRSPLTLSISAPALATAGEAVSMSANIVSPDGVPTKQTWLQTAGTAVVLSSTTTPNVTFVAPPWRQDLNN